MQPIDQKQRICRQFAEVWNAGRVDLVDEYYAADFRNFGVPDSRGALKTIVRMWRAAFPDLHFAVETCLSEGDEVVCEVTARGTQQGVFRTPMWGLLPPTGKSFTVTHWHWWRLVDGKIADHRAVRDDLAMLQQLGHLPPLGQTTA